MSEITELLGKTSRTFALAIPLLPEPTRGQVGIAYLLFRMADTFEDATLWPADRRLAALDWFAELLEQEPAAARELGDVCERHPPVAHAGYRELLAKMPLVLTEFCALAPEARAHIRRHVRRSVDGMKQFIRRGDGQGHLALATLDDLRDYCYEVAGIVGEMLTELYLLGRPKLAPVAEELRNRAAAFGEGLQLVNILKDAPRDARDGRSYLPDGVDLREVLALAERDLIAATEYAQLLRDARVETGLIAFNMFIATLASSNLRLLATGGLGAKLSRGDVARIGDQIDQALALPSSPFAEVSTPE